MNATQKVKRVVKLPRRGFICESCGEVGFPKTSTPGNLAIELLLYLLAILPGLLYTSWRLSKRSKVCGDCGGRMISIRSPRGRLLAQQFNPHVTIQQ